jgi:serine/threonine protein kinase
MGMNEAIESSNFCPKCGVALPSAATSGLCPRCLMAAAMAPTQPGAEQAEAQKALTPEELAPHFPQLDILQCLGRGGMGVVYKARQKSLNRFVALKLLAPERVREPKFADRFTREAQALAALNHPNIVTIHDFGQAGGYYFLLMEFVDGVNLRQLLRARKFTPEEALAIVPPLCDALQFAHNRGIVHRDIKPENLLLDQEGRVKVADFGIAKMLGSVDGGGDGRQTDAPENATQTTVGTPGYSAPEQKTDPRRVDSRADIYSLGVVFYEMLTGELPGKRLEPPSRKVQIDVRLDEVVLRALERNPDLRYQQVSEVKTMVETIAGTPDTNSSQRRDAQTDVPPPHQDWWTWSPLQSQQVGEICAHLTKAERNHLSLLGLLASVWVVGTCFGVPAFIRFNSSSGKWIVASVWAVLFAVSIQMLQRMVRYFLCSTIWARERGFKSENLRLFSFSRRNLWKLCVIWVVALVLIFAQHKAITGYLGLESLPAPDRIQKGPSKRAEAMPRFYIGQADFPHGDSIEVTSVDRTPNWIAVKGHYNLVSHDQATLALYITSTKLITTEDADQQMQISKGRGDFALIHSHLVPGLPRVAMVAYGENFADLYFGTKAEAAEESKMNLHPTSSFGPVIERTLRINGNECDFLVLRTGEVLRHSFVEVADLHESTPPSAFLQWVRENGVDIGFCFSSNKLYVPLGISTFEMGTFQFPYDTVPQDQIPDFRSKAELEAYSAQHGWPLKRPPLVGSLVGVTNIWNDLTAAQFLHGQPNDVPGCFLKDKPFAMWLAVTNFMHPVAFSTRDGIEGLLQVTDFTRNPPSIKLRYKLVQTGSREK